MGVKKNRTSDEVSVTVGKPLRGALQELALQLGLSLSEIGRQALLAYLMRKASGGDRKLAGVRRKLKALRAAEDVKPKGRKAA